MLTDMSEKCLKKAHQSVDNLHQIKELIPVIDDDASHHESRRTCGRQVPSVFKLL